jgi:hypothetical protein
MEPAVIPHVILFELAYFHGAHRHVFMAEPNLGASDDPSFNRKTSSIIILEGHWEFFRDVNFQVKDGETLGPGLYPFVTNVGIKNDTIASLRPVSSPPAHNR